MEFAMVDLDAISRAATALDPLPTSALRLARMVAGTPDLAEIVEVVEFDQALTAVLLRAANSSWSATRTEITTVKHAVVRLGAGPVLSLALGVNMRGRLDGAFPEYGLAEAELWRHSVAASLAAETLAKFARRRPPAETPTAALMHDIGKLVIARYLDNDDLARIARAQAAGATRMQAEKDVLGVDHAQLGGVIAQSWNLPHVLVDGIAHHHAPERADKPVAYGVHLADVIAKAAGFGPDDNAELETFARAMGELGLTADAYDEACGLVAERFAEVDARFS
jgi:putative nucleotidyltransferase with HDIG domain